MHSVPNFDLSNPATFNQKTLSAERASERLSILSRGVLSPRSIQERGQLSAAVTNGPFGTTVKITRLDPGEFYLVRTGRDPRFTFQTQANIDDLIERKLKEPNLILSAEDSIDLLSGCIARGETEAEKARGKELCVVIGNTGAGKSTFANALFGCTMQRVHARQVPGARSLKPLVIVQPRSDGGALDEVMPIGHTTDSKTFIPQIETLGLTICDCPGFLDNRGYQLNVANAANIKNTFARATGIKVVILINYHALLADKAKGLSDMVRICCDLFGSKENLIRFKNSILLGITQIPRLSPDDEQRTLQELQEFITQTQLQDPFEQSTVGVLAQRLFIYDPLDAPNLEYEGALKKAKVLEAINNLELIRDPQSIFKTVLTPEDITGLREICNEIDRRIRTILEGNLTEQDFIKIAHYQTALRRLEVIEHAFILQLLADTRAVVARHFSQMVQRFERCCSDETLRMAEEARSILEAIRTGIQHFDDEIRSEVHIESLHQRYELFVKKHQAKTIVTELNDLEKRYRTRCADQNLSQAQEIFEEIKEKITLLENEYALTGVEHQIDLQELIKLYQKTSLKRELFDLRNQFMIHCRNHHFEEAGAKLEDIKEKVSRLTTDYGITEAVLQINISELEAFYRGIMEAELNELVSEYETYCRQRKLSAATDMLSELRSRMQYIYGQRGAVQKIRRLDERLEELNKELADTLLELDNLRTRCGEHCDNLEIANAEGLLALFKMKVHECARWEGLKDYRFDLDVSKLDQRLREIKDKIRTEENLERQFRILCQEKNIVEASNILDEVRRHNGGSAPKVAELERILLRAKDDLESQLRIELSDLHSLQNRFSQHCDNFEIAQAENLLELLKNKVSKHHEQCDMLNLSIPGRIDIASLERYLKNRPLFEVKEDTTHLGAKFITLKGGIDADLQTILAQNRDKEISMLWLEKCEITDQGLISLLSQCPDLDFLCLFDCTQITGRSLAALSSRCAKLTSLSISRCQITDSELAALSNGCAKLTNLSISECQVTDNGLATLSCTGLVTLSIYDSRMIYGSGLAALLNKCPKLEYLNLNNCALTDSALQALAGSKHQPASLNLLGSSFTEHGLAILLDKWSDLTQLNLQQTNITGSFLASVACSQNMVKLYLPHCHQLNDEKLIVLLTGWPKLTDLWLNGCIKVTPSFVSTIKARRLSTKVSY